MLTTSFKQQVRKEIVGINTKVPVSNNRYLQYINFDNAASTPSFKQVFEKIKDFLVWYSNVDRGTGFKSQISSEIYEKTYQLIANFMGVDLEKNTIILVKNTTEAINKLANSLQLSSEDVVITTLMEHHSNLLPWRSKAQVVYCGLTSSGKLNLDDLERKLKEYQNQVKLVAVTGASNVTGIVNPIHEIARLAHQYNAKILVDAAQLAPHHPIDLKPNHSAEHIDYLAFSAHKMYAPFGTGVLIGPQETFLNQPPDYSGGGTVKSVTLDDVIWANLPDKEEAGTPNIIGAVALQESIKKIEELGWQNIIDTEEELIAYTLKQLKKLPKIKLYGVNELNNLSNQVGVISFNIEPLPHSLVATILAHEAGIGVRSGCFCAHPYVHQLLNLTPTEIKRFKDQIKTDDFSSSPGLVRISFGCYNSKTEIDRFVEVIESIIERITINFAFSTQYTFNPTTGEYIPNTNASF
ncbi:aminotransferase class V-fold PLP-dependent enzyme [Natroniella sulfidigena]|uniref:aminotransferase class V-fold PLP-dependent enzyme n=1 Tax=Natroniella sulfidigena TaxID=723921 RepID=UPI00200AEA42|nr:aminotransferase class V-fold PLP-dependent enzyme [Natroniella sulfidigena]MCK8816250.1 aminotransferase class V-fold PLP-dependent enzyme [Natroniella sulfidigena]